MKNNTAFRLIISRAQKRSGFTVLFGLLLLMSPLFYTGVSSNLNPTVDPGFNPDNPGHKTVATGNSGSQRQKAPVPHHKEPFTLDSGIQANQGQEDAKVLRWEVRSPGVPWLRLHFSGHNLGQNSSITITSLKDGGKQRLDAEGLERWSDSTAFFNGDAVDVELTVAPNESGVFFQIHEITVGEFAGEEESPETICGGSDDRVAATDNAVGRIMPIGCTGWIVSNGAVLTAGHCVITDPDTVIHFNVPASLPNGAIQVPGPEDQYPIAFGDKDDGTGGEDGNDWAVARIGLNDFGDSAIDRQSAFYRMSRDSNPSTVRVTGYGIDSDPPGSTGNLNSANQTLQTHSGDYAGENVQSDSDVVIEYTVDTRGGSSGSPVIDTSNSVTLGIHTFGGCFLIFFGTNSGTGFENDALENAIQTFPGLNVEYVDKGHPIALEDGTVFRPWSTVQEGANGATSDATLSIVEGTYNESLTITKPVTLEAPVGLVTIGP